MAGFFFCFRAGSLIRGGLLGIIGRVASNVFTVGVLASFEVLGFGVDWSDWFGEI